MTNNPKYIIVHHTDVSYKKNPNQFFAVNRYHRDVRNFPKSSLGYYGGYQIFISNGKEYRYREDREEGAHCNTVVDGVSMNFQSLGLGWAGDGDIETPTPKDTDLIRARIKKWQKKYNIPNDKVHIAPHRKWSPWKTCFGSLLADDWAYLLVNPPVKSPEASEKAEKIKQYTLLLDRLRTLVLRLKILLKNLSTRT